MNLFFPPFHSYLLCGLVAGDLETPADGSEEYVIGREGVRKIAVSITGYTSSRISGQRNLWRAKGDSEVLGLQSKGASWHVGISSGFHNAAPTRQPLLGYWRLRRRYFFQNQTPNLLLIAMDVLLFLPNKQSNKDLLVCPCACRFKKMHSSYKIKTKPRAGKVAARVKVPAN